jgi:hypothetical protein
MTRSRGDRCAQADGCEGGFTILEAVLALALTAVVVVGLASSAATGLKLTGRSNSRQVAVQTAVRSIELYRTFNFDALTLADPPGYDGAGTPDQDVDQAAKTYKVPLASGVFEPLALSPTGSVQHKETITIGGRRVTTYRYVTFTNAPDNTEKRLTVVSVATGKDTDDSPNRAVMTSLFSKGKVEFATTQLVGSGIAAHSPGDTNVQIPVQSSIGFPSTGPFTIKVDTEYFTVTNPSGTNWIATAQGGSAHSAGTLVVLASNLGGSAGGSSVPVPAPPPGMTCGTDNTKPTASDPVILKGTGSDADVGYTSSATISIVNSASDSCTPLQMKFAQDAASNLDAAGSVWQVYSTNTAMQLTGADGTKTIFARYQDNNANATTTNLSASVVLDRTRPSPAPTFSVVRAGNGKSVTISWANSTTDNAMSSDPYRVFQRTGSAGPFIQLYSVTQDIKCTGGSGGPCTVDIANLDANTGYSYYVVGIDKAGNVSDAKPSINV